MRNAMLSTRSILTVMVPSWLVRKSLATHAPLPGFPARHRLLAGNARVTAGKRAVAASRPKPLQQFQREQRKRIVAGSHDQDAVTTTGELDQAVATGAAIRECKRLSTTPLDPLNDFTAADTAVDRAAEIDRLRHDENIIAVQPVRKAVDQRVLHQTQR